jgi:hypothetical protein
VSPAGLRPRIHQRGLLNAPAPTSVQAGRPVVARAAARAPWRSSGASIMNRSVVTTPRTGPGRRSSCLQLADSFGGPGSSLATTIRPDVPASRRCTIPGGQARHRGTATPGAEQPVDERSNGATRSGVPACRAPEAPGCSSRTDERPRLGLESPSRAAPPRLTRQDFWRTVPVSRTRPSSIARCASARLIPRARATSVSSRPASAANDSITRRLRLRARVRDGRTPRSPR